jgi:hypothetical protein
MEEITVGFGLMTISSDPLVLGMQNLVHRWITDIPTLHLLKYRLDGNSVNL